MYCLFATVIFCKPTPTFWKLHTILTKEIYRNKHCAMILIQLVIIETGKEPAREILHSAECEILRCNYE